MSANLSAAPKLQFFDNNGNPLVGGRLYTYAAGTTTPLATYTDASATTPNTNPIILDSRGEANVWLSGTTYKFVLKDASDATIWTVDNVSNSINLSQILAASGTAANPPYTFASDTSTGVYLTGVGQIGLAVSGVPVLRSTDTAMVIGQIGGADDVNVTHYGDTTQTGDITVNGAAVFNEAGADKDFRVEGDGDANLLFVDASTDRVGIGTNTPVAKLHVNGTSSLDGAVVVNEAGADNDFRVEGDAEPNLLFVDASTDRVGIGTNSPTALLTVNGDSLINGLTVGKGGNGVSTNVAVGVDALLNNQITGEENTAVGYLALGGNTIGDNNTGIGYGALNGNATGSNNTAVGAFTNAFAFSGSGSGNTYVGYSAGFVVDSGDNNTLIGRTAGNTIVSGSGNTIVGAVASSGSATAVNRIVLGQSVTGTADNRITIGSGTNKAELELDGVDTSWAASSDARLKTNVQDSPVGLNFIKALRVVNFQWKRKRDVDPELSAHEDSDEPVHGEGGSVYLGFIAQEAQAAIDAHSADVVRLVRPRDDGVLTTAPATLVPVLVKAIQEQQSVIESLIARIAALENK